jgi:hypothetical protein
LRTVTINQDTGHKRNPTTTSTSKVCHSVGDRLVEKVNLWSNLFYIPVYVLFVSCILTYRYFVSLCCVYDIIYWKAWRNGKLDILIGQQGIQSQEEADDCFLSPDICFDKSELGQLSAGSESVHEDKKLNDDESGDSIQQSNNNNANNHDNGTGVYHHVHMRTMATVASDPAEWIGVSGDSGGLGPQRQPSNSDTPNHKRRRECQEDETPHNYHEAGSDKNRHCSTTTTVDGHTVKEGRKTVNNFDLSCSVRQVADFVKAVCRRLFPRIGVWSSTHTSSTRLNANLFMKRIQEFVSLGRWESLNVCQLSKGMKCAMIPWLGAGNAWTRPPAFSASPASPPSRNRDEGLLPRKKRNDRVSIIAHRVASMQCTFLYVSFFVNVILNIK